MKNSKPILCLLIMSSVLNGVSGLNDDNAPKINEIWIYCMVILGFIGFFIGLFIIFIASRHYHLMVHSTNMPKALITLSFIIWILNFVACAEWAFLRTNLFIHLTKQRYIAIYTTNYLSYLIAKYCMHTVFLYGLYFLFKSTPFEINEKFIKSLILLISINFMIFIALYIPICFQNVTIGVSSQSDSNVEICTLYNSDSNLRLTTFDKVWPILQDIIVGLILFIIFVKKIKDLSTNKRFKNDVEAEQFIRKLSIIGAVAISSTFIFYTFAVPFYPNFTFLLPFDAALNSLCIILLIDYSDSLYVKLCCCLDLCLKKTLKHHHITDEIIMTVGTFRGGVSTSQISDKYKPKKRYEPELPDIHPETMNEMQFQRNQTYSYNSDDPELSEELI